MNKRYDDLKSVMNMPKGTVEEQREFINQVFKDVWPNLFFDEFYYDKQLIKSLWTEHQLIKSKLFCQILTNIFSQPYKEMGYYMGNEENYVEAFPPIRIKLTQQQAYQLRRMSVACKDFETITKTLSNTTLLIRDRAKKEIKEEMYNAYRLTLASCMQILAESLNLSADAKVAKESTRLH